MRMAALAIAALLWLGMSGPARASEDDASDVPITFAQVLERAARAAPEVAVARAREAVARADIGVAGVLPNPAIVAGTSTQAAKLSLGVSVPLLILGQRGAAVDAARADGVTARVETELASFDARAAAAHAYVVLWRAQGIAAEEQHAAAIAKALDDAVAGRVELGAAAEVDGLRVRAERLRADAQAQQASQLVGAAAAGLARWLGLEEGTGLRAAGPPSLPSAPPSLAELRTRIDATPAVRREIADRLAAEARGARERALLRPALVFDLGVDAWDATLCPNGPCDNPPVNYRGAVTFEVPVLNQRGPYIDRERANAAAARARQSAEHLRLSSALASAYRTFEAWTASSRALADSVVPAATAAAAAVQESYELGRAPLVAVLDADKARIDANLAMLDARAQQADAWIDVEQAAGVR